MMRTCPHCASWIDAAAKVCPRCTRDIPPPLPNPRAHVVQRNGLIVLVLACLGVLGAALFLVLSPSPAHEAWDLCAATARTRLGVVSLPPFTREDAIKLRGSPYHYRIVMDLDPQTGLICETDWTHALVVTELRTSKRP